jgi:hypothetical protein
VDKAKMDACINDIDQTFNITGLYNDRNTWSGGRYPPYLVDTELNQIYGVGGSPTVVINGVNVGGFGGSRTPETLKQAVCSAFNTPPAECEQELSTNQAGVGIGPLDSYSDSTTGGSCG